MKNLNGDEMKDQIGKDMARVGMITVILAVSALVISIAGVIVSLVLIVSRLGVCL